MQGRKGDDEIRAKMAELIMLCDKESEIRQQRLQNDTLSLHKSLHSRKSIADQTISIKGMAENRRQFYNKHNMVIDIDLQAQGIDNYRQILEFLVRSRIFYVLTHSPPLMIDYIRQFWATARYDCEPNPPVIRARVHNSDITFSRVDLRTILQLGTEEEEDGPTEFPSEMRAGAFLRMGYTGEVTKNQYTKSLLYGQWRYLMHVMIVSLAAKKAGFDVMNAKLQSGMLSLVYNKPYSFSQYFFSEFVLQINAGGREKFLLYPRFVMMIIRHFLPDIPLLAQVMQVSTVDRRVYADCLSHSSRRATDQRPQETPLFGYLMNVNYVAPSNDDWLDVPQPDQPESVDPFILDIAEAVVQEVLQQGEQVGDVLDDVDEYVEFVQAGGGMPDPLDEPAQAVTQDDVNMERNEDVQVDDDVLGDDNDDGDKTDSDATERESDNDDAPDYTAVHKKFVLGGKKLVVKESGPPPESSSHGKRKVNKDGDYTPTGEDDQDVDESSLRPRKKKRWRSTSGIVISEPTEPAVDIPIQAATTETTTTTATSETAQIPISTIPKAAIPTSPFLTANVSDTLRIAWLEARIAALNAQVAMLTAVVAKQDQHLQSMNQINEVLEEKIARNEYLILGLMKNQPTWGEKLSCKGDELREKRRKDKDNDPSAPKDGELPNSSTPPLGTLATSQGESSKQGDRSEKALAEVFETIEALIGIDEMMEDNDDSDKDVEVEEDEDEDDWISVDEVMSDDIDVHVIPKTTEVVYVNDAGEPLIGLSKIRRIVNERIANEKLQTDQKRKTEPEKNSRSCGLRNN